MLCVPIRGPSFTQAQQQILEAQKYADIVEWRLDCFDTLDVPSLESVKKSCLLPTIFTLRPTSQGGAYRFPEEQRLIELQRLVQLNPTYIDVEYSVPSAFINMLKNQHPALKIILSYHDFEKTPASLEAVLRHLQETPADYYKIAVMAHSALDTLKVVLFAKEVDSRVLLMSMGETGPLSRILAPLVKRPFTFASLNPELATAPGQISAVELIETYHYRSLTAATHIYGLIGHPVDKSISQYTHNAAMQQLQLNGVYVKIPVHPHELQDFLTLSKRLGMRGLSVTMPLKEHVLAYLDDIDAEAKAIGAVNTIVFEGQKLTGFNTDGKGALDAIEKHLPIKGKKLVLLGAGGASKAIAWEALRRKAQVVILNRDAKKAQELAEKLGCIGGGLDDIKGPLGQDYDVIINGTPHGLPIEPHWLLPQAFAMDLTSNPKYTPFLVEAQARGCKLIFGVEMFIQQAVAQFKLWFPGIDGKQVEAILSASNPASDSCLKKLF